MSNKEEKRDIEQNRKKQQMHSSLDLELNNLKIQNCKQSQVDENENEQKYNYEFINRFQNNKTHINSQEQQNSIDYFPSPPFSFSYSLFHSKLNNNKQQLEQLDQQHQINQKQLNIHQSTFKQSTFPDLQSSSNIPISQLSGLSNIKQNQFDQLNNSDSFNPDEQQNKDEIDQFNENKKERETFDELSEIENLKEKENINQQQINTQLLDNVYLNEQIESISNSSPIRYRVNSNNEQILDREEDYNIKDEQNKQMDIIEDDRNNHIELQQKEKQNNKEPIKEQLQIEDIESKQQINKSEYNKLINEQRRESYNYDENEIKQFQRQAVNDNKTNSISYHFFPLIANISPPTNKYQQSSSDSKPSLKSQPSLYSSLSKSNTESSSSQSNHQQASSSESNINNNITQPITPTFTQIDPVEEQFQKKIKQREELKNQILKGNNNNNKYNNNNINNINESPFHNTQRILNKFRSLSTSSNAYNINQFPFQLKQPLSYSHNNNDFKILNDNQSSFHNNKYNQQSNHTYFQFQRPNSSTLQYSTPIRFSYQSQQYSKPNLNQYQQSTPINSFHLTPPSYLYPSSFKSLSPYNQSSSSYTTRDTNNSLNPFTPSKYSEQRNIFGSGLRKMRTSPKQISTINYPYSSFSKQSLIHFKSNLKY